MESRTPYEHEKRVQVLCDGARTLNFQNIFLLVLIFPNRLSISLIVSENDLLSF